MTDADAVIRPILIWVREGTWQACVDAAVRRTPADVPVTLLHVTSAELPEAAHGAYLGLFGRGQPGRDPGPRVAEMASTSASELLDDAARRLNRACVRVERHGDPRQEVLSAAGGADLLVVAREGDQARLGPVSLGKTVRFVVDHAPCAVLLVWPGAAPELATIPPPPGKPHPRPHHPH